MALAAAYHGPAELNVLRAFTSWTLDLPVLLAVLAVGGCYLAGVRRARARGQHWPAGRSAAFFGGGLGVLTFSAMSFLGVYAGTLFYIRAVQTVLLLLVVPLFLAMGRPLSLLAAASPAAGERVTAALGGRVARVLTFPAVTSLALVVTPFLFYFTGWYEAGLRSGALRELTFLALIVPGLAFFWTLLRVDPVPRAYPHVVTLWVSAAEVVGDAILGLAVLADPNLIAAAYYRVLARPWGPSLHGDQVIGGGVIWLLGDLVGVPFVAAQLIQMMREDEGDAARIDAELDARDAELAAAAGTVAGGVAPASGGSQVAGGTAAPSGQGGGASGQPWWEGDPRFGSRFRPPGQG